MVEIKKNYNKNRNGIPKLCGPFCQSFEIKIILNIVKF